MNFFATRRWAEGGALLRPGARRFPPIPSTCGFERARTDFHRAGELAPLRAVLSAPSPSADPAGSATLARWWLHTRERDWAAAERALAATPLEVLDDPFGTPPPKILLQGWIHRWRGDEGSGAGLLRRGAPGLRGGGAGRPPQRRPPRRARLGASAARPRGRGPARGAAGRGAFAGVPPMRWTARRSPRATR